MEEDPLDRIFSNDTKFFGSPQERFGIVQGLFDDIKDRIGRLADFVDLLCIHCVLAILLWVPLRFEFRMTEINDSPCLYDGGYFIVA